MQSIIGVGIFDVIGMIHMIVSGLAGILAAPLLNNRIKAAQCARHRAGRRGKTHVNIKKYIPMFIAAFIVAFILAYIFIPVHLIQFSASDVAQIHIRDGNGGNELDLYDRSEIEYIVSELDNVYEKTGDIQFGVGSSLYIDFILKNGGTKSLLFQNSENVVKRRIYYRSTEKDISKIYDYINDLVKNDGSQQEI